MTQEFQRGEVTIRAEEKVEVKVGSGSVIVEQRELHNLIEALSELRSLVARDRALMNVGSAKRAAARRAFRLLKHQSSSPVAEDETTCTISTAKFDSPQLKAGIANQRHPFTRSDSSQHNSMKEIGISNGTRNSKVV
jgi:hypothetical protein